MRHRARFVFILTVLALTAEPAAAQQVQVAASGVLAPRAPEAAVLPQPKLTLDDAVTLALRHSPQILSGANRVRLAEGRLQEARGLFDLNLQVVPATLVNLHEITPGLLGREQLKRNTIRGVRTNFTTMSEAYREILKGDLTTVPLCPTLFGFNGLNLSNTGINLDLADPTEVALSGVDRSVSPLNIDLGGDLGSIIQSRICRSQSQQLFSAEGFLGVWREAIRVIDFSGGRGLEGSLLSASQITRETTTLMEEISRTVAQRADIALERLGPIAQDELRRNFSLDLNVFKPFRSGTALRAQFQVQSQEHNFIGKPLDPGFGGLDVPPMFFSAIAGTWHQPLGRGRGATAAAVFERTAEPLVTFEQEQLRHEVTAEVFRTVLSYLNLISAQERVRVVGESRARQAEILRLTQQRVASGDVAEIELARIRASEALTQSALNQTRTDLLSARVALAETIGVAVSTVEAAPVAADTFATDGVAAAELPKLFAQAAALRHDTRAAAARQAAALAALEGAKREARPLLDMTLTAGMSNLYESPFFRFLPDEASAIINSRATVVTAPVTGTPVPPLDPVRYWDPSGYYRAVKGRYEPFGTIAFRWELPFGNNRAKGRAAQAQADLSTATINAVNLTRTIEANIVSARETVDRTARAVAQWQAAVVDSRRTFESQQRLLESGGVTLIDVLLTEEELSLQQQQLLVHQMLYRSAIARLRFELGELVWFDNPGTPNEQIRVLSSTYTIR